MTAFSRAFLDRVGPVDGFLLKSRSPSCGVADTKLYGGAESHGEEAPVGLGAGLFARAVIERFRDLPVTDEERLADPEARHRFLAELFARARRREAGEAGAAPPPLPADEPYPPALAEPEARGSSKR